jgi:hypothetical protein
MEFHENLMGFHGNFQWDLGMGPMGNQWDLTNDGKSRAVKAGRWEHHGKLWEFQATFDDQIVLQDLNM